ncbi:hypothetical protein HYQ46_006077 [Verticillium longisporum]|nr:hypothetical protein HYQ46_006077 [Verticillium longisporum]
MEPALDKFAAFAPAAVPLIPVFCRRHPSLLEMPPLVCFLFFFAARFFSPDEDLTALDKILALTIVGSTGDVTKIARQASLEQNNGIKSRGDMALPGGLEGDISSRHDVFKVVRT